MLVTLSGGAMMGRGHRGPRECWNCLHPELDAGDAGALTSVKITKH